MKQSKKGFKFCTGKPSDANCLSWDYKLFNDALSTGIEYFNNYTK